MFVLELFFKRIGSKGRAWERRADAWAEEMNRKHDYVRYYDRQKYAEIVERYPYAPFRKFSAIFFPILGGLIIFGILGNIVIVDINSSKTPDNPNGCSSVYKKDEKAAVTYGPFVGSEGVVIEQAKDGCAVKLKLTKSTNTRDACVEKKYTDCRNEKNVGEELTVDTPRNLTKI